MVDTIAKVLTVFVVVILALVLLNTVGGYVAEQIPGAGEMIHRIFHEIWNALHRVFQPGYQY